MCDQTNSTVMMMFQPVKPLTEMYGHAVFDTSFFMSLMHPMSHFLL